MARELPRRHRGVTDGDGSTGSPVAKPQLSGHLQPLLRGGRARRRQDRAAIPLRHPAQHRRVHVRSSGGRATGSSRAESDGRHRWPDSNHRTLLKVP